MKPRTTTLLATALAVGVSMSAGSGLAAPLHSDPVADDNLRIYAMTETPKLTIVIDGSDSASTEGQSVMFAKLTPGPHKWNIVLPDGGGASAQFALAADGMIESKGRRWWCLAAGRRDGQFTLQQLPPAQCKSITDAGPD